MLQRSMYDEQGRPRRPFRRTREARAERVAATRVQSEVQCGKSDDGMHYARMVTRAGSTNDDQNQQEGGEGGEEEEEEGEEDDEQLEEDSINDEVDGQRVEKRKTKKSPEHKRGGEIRERRKQVRPNSGSGSLSFGEQELERKEEKEQVEEQVAQKPFQQPRGESSAASASANVVVVKVPQVLHHKQKLKPAPTRETKSSEQMMNIYHPDDRDDDDDEVASVACENIDVDSLTALNDDDDDEDDKHHHRRRRRCDNEKNNATVTARAKTKLVRSSPLSEGKLHLATLAPAAAGSGAESGLGSANRKCNNNNGNRTSSLDDSFSNESLTNVVTSVDGADADVQATTAAATTTTRKRIKQPKEKFKYSADIDDDGEQLEEGAAVVTKKHPTSSRIINSSEPAERVGTLATPEVSAALHSSDSPCESSESSISIYREHLEHNQLQQQRLNQSEDPLTTTTTTKERARTPTPRKVRSSTDYNYSSPPINSSSNNRRRSRTTTPLARRDNNNLYASTGELYFTARTPPILIPRSGSELFSSSSPTATATAPNLNPLAATYSTALGGSLSNINYNYNIASYYKQAKQQYNSTSNNNNRRRRKKLFTTVGGLFERSLSTSSVFAFYTTRYAREKFYLALRTFKSWYHEQLTYHHLAKRMEFNQQLFEQWFRGKGQPLSLRSLDRFDQIVIWIADERDAIQKRTFTKWINKYLNRRGKEVVEDLFQDLRDGRNLITLLEMLSGQTLPRERGRMRVHQLQNIQIALNYIRFRKVKLVNIRPEDIVDGNQKLTLGLIWTIILHFQLEDNSNFREILLRWAQKTTDGYPGCKVTDLTTSWRDGLAFNAIIHRNRPDLLNYRACRQKTSRDNLEQAFSVADRDLGVTRLLEPEDVDVPKPDEKSMITYLSQLYELFPDPPERNPLLDEEMIRRIDEYKELASRLLRWIKESTAKLEDRRFPKGINELKKLIQENDRFRTEEIPPKQHDKQRLAAHARDIYRMAGELNYKIDNDLHIDNIDYHWDRMINAQKARSQALCDELQKAERLKALLEKLMNDIKKCNDKLDGVEREIQDEERRVQRTDLASLKEIEKFSPAKLQKISEELADCGIKIDAIKRLAEDFISENGRTAPDSVMVREKVGELDARYKRLLSKLAHLHDQFDRAIQRLRQLEDEQRHLAAQREAEAKLRLQLDAMKRELDELERRIDNMGPIGTDYETIRRQLEELQRFEQDLQVARHHLNDLIHLAESMISDNLIADPISLRSNLQLLKDQLARIEDKAARLADGLQNALKHIEAQEEAEKKLRMKLADIKRELDELEKRIDSMGPVGTDLATIQRQLQELREFDQDLANTKRKLEDINHIAENLIRDDMIQDPVGLRGQLRSLKDQVERIEEKSANRLKALQNAQQRADAQKQAEQRFQLKLDAMKRELDEMERKLDSMAPIARELAPLQQQLSEINDFIKLLQTQTKRNLAELNKLGEELIRDDLIADPAKLRSSLTGLKDQYDRIEDKAMKRLSDIQNAMSRVAASDKIQDLAKFLEGAKRIMMNEENVHGDLDTVLALIEQHKSFLNQLDAHQPTMNTIRRMEQDLTSASPQNGAIIREELTSLSNQWRDIEKLTREKTMKLDDAKRSAEQMHNSVHALLEWLAEAEMKLRFAGLMPEDEQATKAELVEHEKFMRKLGTQEQGKEQTLKVARDILSHCHPDAEPVIKHWQNIIQARWEEIDAWAQQRGQRLNDHLRSLTDIMELVEDLIGWLQRHEGRLLAEEADQMPEQANQLESMIDQHSGFMDELRKREPEVDRVVKIFAAKSSQVTTCKMILTTTTTSKARDSSRSPIGGSSAGRLSALGEGNRSTTPTRTSFATYRDEYPEVKQVRPRLMLEKWRGVWQLSLDKMQRLKDRVEHLKEVERLENFDFDEWRRRFITWVSAKKGRVMDFYRSIDENNQGRIPIESFINGVMRSRFETSRLEMERVARIFDRNNDGTIEYKEYMDSLRPDKPITDDELIQDEVQRQVSRCTCEQRYKVYHVGDGRYRFGESQKLRLVRILRSTVMVRVGGGWEPLISFLQKNDPCRAKGRTNVELREQFILPEGASQAMAAFKSRMKADPGSMPALGPITKIREKTDRSMPMSSTGHSRYGSPSDYYSETESAHSKQPRSRIGRLTPGSTGPASQPTSRPASRHGSDLYFNTTANNASSNIPYGQSKSNNRTASKSTDNL